MTDAVQLLESLGAALASAGAAYGALKAELRSVHERLRDLSLRADAELARAHARIDELLDNSHADTQKVRIIK